MKIKMNSIILILMLSIAATGCINGNGLSSGTKLTDESQIKQVITNFEKAQHNRDYRTTMGIEGTEMMTRKYRDLWLKAGYDNQIVDAVKKGRYITEFGSIKWNNIVINKEKGTAKAEFILTGTIVSKDGKQLYSTYETNSVVNLIEEDGYWKVDDSNSK